MGENTAVEWCDHTFNAWEGCTKVSPGCDNCYAEARNARFHGAENWGPGAPRRLRSPAYWRQPLKWNRSHEVFRSEHGRRQRVFCSSLADVFDSEAPEAERNRLFELIRECQNIDWLILTKRVGNVARMLPEDWGDGYPNVWLGITIVNQREADRDVLKLLRIPAAVRWLSMEPLLGSVDLTRIFATNGRGGAGVYNLLNGEWRPGGLAELAHRGGPHVDWVVAGGESGPYARPMRPDWARSLRDQCTEHSVPFFFKQWGEWLPLDQGTVGSADRQQVEVREPWGDGHRVARAGKHRAGRLLDGRPWHEHPRAAA